MLSPGFDPDERFVVCEITGYAIEGMQHAWRETTSYWVADRVLCYREVASFPSGNRGEKKVARREAAYALADRLNAEDRAASSAAPT